LALTFIRKGWSVNITVVAEDRAIGYLYQEKGDAGEWLFNPHHGVRWSHQYLYEITEEVDRLNGQT
jgi:hypothetical protein